MALTNSYIDLTYFNRGIVKLPDTSNPVKVSEYEELITEAQSDMLTALFGYELYSLLRTDTNFVATPIRATAAKYTNLIQVTEYTRSDGFLTISNGLIGKEANGLLDTDRSPIANYCYCMWNDPTSQTQTTGIGNMSANVDNSTKVSTLPKVVRAWNEMTDMLWVLHEYMVLNKTDYPEYIGLTYEPIAEPEPFQVLQPNQKLFVRKNVWSL